MTKKEQAMFDAMQARLDALEGKAKPAPAAKTAKPAVKVAEGIHIVPKVATKKQVGVGAAKVYFLGSDGALKHVSKSRFAKDGTFRKSALAEFVDAAKVAGIKRVFVVK